MVQIIYVCNSFRLRAVIVSKSPPCYDLAFTASRYLQLQADDGPLYCLKAGCDSLPLVQTVGAHMPWWNAAQKQLINLAIGSSFQLRNVPD